MIRTEPLKYQLEDIRFLLKHPRSANFNDCGLGKTFEELVVMNETWLKNPRAKVLVFCPKSCIVSWVDEIRCHTDLDEGDFQVVSGSWEEKRDNLGREDRKIYITNYETALTNFVSIVGGHFDYLVCDESTRLKNPKAKVSNAVRAIADRAKIVRVMSGLPIPQAPHEIYSQYRIMDGGLTFGKSYDFFLRKWFRKVGRPPFRRWELKSECLETFSALVRSSCIRRLRESVVDLPPLTVVRRVVDWESNKTRENYRKLKDAVRREVLLESGGKITNINIPLVKLNKLSQWTSGFLYANDMGRKATFHKDNPKLKELWNTLQDYNFEENKIIVGTSFSAEMDLVSNLCKRRNVGYARLDGETSASERDKALKAFKTDNLCRVLVGNEQTLSYGLNLQHSNVIVFYSFDFSVDHYKQLCDRIQRHGQTKNCLIVHILVSDTFDEIKYEMVSGKLDKAQAIMRFIEV